MAPDYDKPNYTRRDLLQYGVCIVGTALLTAGVTTKVLDRDKKKIVAETSSCEPPEITPEKALETLMLGNERFMENKPKHPNQNRERMKEVTAGQKPFAAILGCADSRVPAEIIFDQGLGDIFVVRNAGNVVTPEEMGSLEFGALELGIKTIMILGHQKCGAVKATLDGNSVPGQIGSIIDAIKPSIKGKPTWEEAVTANVKLQITKLKSSPVITQLIANDKLKVVGGFYELETGKVKLIT
ncbi:carbonic anhydrase [Planktothrix mougeotii]|uniref:carbonic anhydrase n=1 Tax=Planktothrix mougeotii LEGE 06226 TaxID=1828728 RepID=A0ABR9U7R9_9CYAN|nr:carbonic anhydrase [Planktothrix mougeotii]MBE9142498.1 carbonic anhydrase [Planktothrix mougeotii LEGE 06226]